MSDLSRVLSRAAVCALVTVLVPLWAHTAASASPEGPSGPVAAASMGPMPGMDDGSGTMPGMDDKSGTDSGSDSGAGGAGGTDHRHGLVLGVFVLVNGVLLASAAVLRRRRPRRAERRTRTGSPAAAS